MKKLWVWLLVSLPVALAQEDPLIAAIVTQDQSKVEQLLAQGHLVNFYEDGYMPLHYAVMNQNAAMVKLLLDHGADLKYRTISRNISPGPGYTPFDLALFTYNPEIIQLLMPYTTPWEISHALPTAVIRRDRKLVQTLLAASAGLNAYYYSANTVALAAHYSNVDILEDLLAAGASAAGSDSYGATPLMVTIKQNQLDLAGPLIEHGSDPNACSQGRRPRTGKDRTASAPSS
jgi:ankyrin repeat protein